MIIRISDLSHEGLDIQEPLSLESLNTRLNEGQTSDIVFTSAPVVQLHVSRTADGAEITGSVAAKYHQPCGRCLDTVDRDLKINVNYILKPRTTTPDDDVDDIGLIYFDGEHIELEPIIQESIILSLSVYWCAPEDKKGKCTLCDRRIGADNKATKTGVVQLGDLLKKAGLN